MPVDGMVHQDEYLCVGRDIDGHMYSEVHISCASKCAYMSVTNAGTMQAI